MRNLFTEHPHEVGETYWQHMKHAMCYTCCFFKLFVQCAIHTVFPWIFNGAISSKVCEISDHITDRIEK